MSPYIKWTLTAAKIGANPVSGLTYAAEMQYVGTLTLDAILEERGREWVGEEFRWYEPKRMYETIGSTNTNKLLTWPLVYNEELKAANLAQTF